MEFVILSMFFICFINSVLSLLGYKSKGVLLCGITAYCGSGPADPDKIKMIMMYNEDRGEDSTGWAVNNIITKDTDKVSKFLTKNQLEISYDDENYAIVAHARKASSGYKMSKDLAHPFGVYKDGVEKEQYDLILVMNGTLSNTDEICKKWDVDYKVGINSDTQVLSKIIAKLGEDDYIKAIEAYDGVATLVFFSPKYRNTLMVYRDSLRAIYYWKPTKEQMYISSMEEPLIAIGAKKGEIIAFEDEHLYRIQDGEIVFDKKVMRFPVKTVYSAPARSTYKHSSDYGYHDSSNYEEKSLFHNLPDKQEKSINKLLDRLSMSEHHKPRGKNRIYTVNEKYFRNGHPIGGGFYVDNEGKIKSEDEFKKSEGKIKRVFFINGYLMKSEEDYDIVSKKCLNKNGNYSLEIFKSFRTSELIEHYVYPALTDVCGEERWILNKEWSSKVKYKGEIVELIPWLSEYSFSLKYDCRWISTTKKTTCLINGMKKIEESEEVELGAKNTLDVTTPEQVEYSKNLLKEWIIKESVDNPHFYYAKMRKTIWNYDPGNKIRAHFFELLIEMAKENDVISTMSADSFLKESDNGCYSSKLFLAESEDVIRNLRNKLIQKSEESNTDKNKPSIDKLKDILNQPKYTEEDIVKVLCQDSNNYWYQNTLLQNEILDATDSFDALLETWMPVVKDEQERRLFYEAILLCMRMVDRISNEHLLFTLESSEEVMVDKARNLYEEWSKIANPEISSSETPTPNNEEIADNNVEIKDADYYEAEFKREIEEVLIGGANDILKRMSEVDKPLRSDNFEKIMLHISDMSKYLTKRIIHKQTALNNE